MAMHCYGLTKLMEECGELTQAAAKKAAYLNVRHHPDGSDMLIRLEEEIADVQAAIAFVIEQFSLSDGRIDMRREVKLELLRKRSDE